MTNRTCGLLAGALTLALLISGDAFGQCILANPSFEIFGSGGQLFGGWDQLGTIGVAGTADHGSLAAKASGPGYGDPGVSGFWQSQDCAPGERWEATGRVAHPSSRPLTGGNYAMVHIEWRDAAGQLISYDSFNVLDSSAPTDEYTDFSVLSNPAPPGTVKARILLGVLQPSGSTSGDVYYDDVTFYGDSSPTIDDQQWNDFPGGRTVDFGGYAWRVKGPGYYGPGPNLFCDNSSCVWIDGGDALHISLKNFGGAWYSTEVVLEEALGYGDYVLTTRGRLDLLDPQVVLGMFLWQYGPCWDYGYLWWNAFNEIDIEYSRWGNQFNDLAQFVAQPFDYPGNISRFDAAFGEDEIVSHAMRWLPDRVEYRVWRGDAASEAPETLIHAWTYTGPHIPRPDQPRLHLNLWKLEGNPAGDQEVVFTGFSFEPEGGPTTKVDDQPGDGVPAVASARLYPAVPNPFNPSTTLRFDLDRPGRARLDVFDLAGRHIRTLLDGYREAGPHDAIWDGRDDDGRRVSSGVYLIRLRGDEFVATQRVALIK